MAEYLIPHPNIPTTDIGIPKLKENVVLNNENFLALDSMCSSLRDSVSALSEGKADASHDHDGEYSKIGHTHSMQEVDGLVVELGQKAPASHEHPQYLTDIVPHSHSEVEVEGLLEDLSERADRIHRHNLEDVYNLETELNDRCDWSSFYGLSSKVERKVEVVNGTDEKFTRYRVADDGTKYLDTPDDQPVVSKATSGNLLCINSDGELDDLQELDGKDVALTEGVTSGSVVVGDGSCGMTDSGVALSDLVTTNELESYITNEEASRIYETQAGFNEQMILVNNALEDLQDEIDQITPCPSDVLTATNYPGVLNSVYLQGSGTAGDSATKNVGTGADNVAAGNHDHGNVLNDGTLNVDHAAGSLVMLDGLSNMTCAAGISESGNLVTKDNVKKVLSVFAGMGAAETAYIPPSSVSVSDSTLNSLGNYFTSDSNIDATTVGGLTGNSLVGTDSSGCLTASSVSLNSSGMIEARNSLDSPGSEENPAEETFGFEKVIDGFNAILYWTPPKFDSQGRFCGCGQRTEIFRAYKATGNS